MIVNVYHTAPSHFPSLRDGSTSPLLCSSADGQCSVTPQGTSCSCWAAAWQTAARSLDGSSSAGASGPMVSFLWVLQWLLLSPGQGRMLVTRKKHQHRLEALQIHNVGHILSVGDVCWSLFKQTTWICYSSSSSISHFSANLWRAFAAVSITHGSSVGRKCTSADSCREFTKFWQVSWITRGWAHQGIISVKLKNIEVIGLILHILLDYMAICAKVKCLNIEIKYNISPPPLKNGYCVSLTTFWCLIFTVRNDICAVYHQNGVFTFIRWRGKVSLYSPWLWVYDVYVQASSAYSEN